MKKSLTIQYTFHQIAYWATCAGIVSFATAFLLQKGFAASTVGILLAAGNLLSCSFQPVLAQMADRVGGNVLKWMTMTMTMASALCFAFLQLLPMSRGMFALLYLLGIFFYDAMNPLMNALNVSYTTEGYSINYGVSRGLGSLAFAFSALLIGRIMAKFGADWMVRISLGLLAVNAVMAMSYPSLVTTVSQKKREVDCCSISVFVCRYKWYCISLLGVMLLGMFHAMTENYLIEIVTPLGGDSGTVGIALFVATAVEALVMMYLEQIRRRISDNWLLKIAGLSFVLKSVLLLVAGNVIEIYAIHLLQATSYTFLSPIQMYYANNKIGAADMVKGQAFSTASYTLGCAAGNFAGGQLLSAFDLRTMLVAGIAMAVMGTAVFFLTVERNDL